MERVRETMLSQAGDGQWTAAFMEGSTFEGDWKQGGRMRFLAPGNSGMVAGTAASWPHQHISIEHIGFVLNGVEDNTSASVRGWASAHENDSFTSVPGGTVVTIEHEVLASFEAYMSDVWPRALAKLEALCEA